MSGKDVGDNFRPATKSLKLSLIPFFPCRHARHVSPNFDKARIHAGTLLPSLCGENGVWDNFRGN